MLDRAHSAEEPASYPVRIQPIGVRAFLRLTSWSGHIPDPDLPPRVGHTAPGPVRVLCVAPVEWLLISHEQSAADLRAAFSPSLLEGGGVLVDLTDGIAAFEVQGIAVRDVLAQACGLDFHPTRFPPGKCARTRFAQIPVVIDCIDESHFELYVSRSYGHYLQSWLLDSAATARAP
jgi:heterotetrameric sarcosine oxidase gamma subunit